MHAVRFSGLLPPEQYEKSIVTEEEIESRFTDPGEQNITFCMKLAEYTIWNDDLLEELGRQVAAMMRKIRGE